MRIIFLMFILLNLSSCGVKRDLTLSNTQIEPEFNIIQKL